MYFLLPDIYTLVNYSGALPRIPIEGKILAMFANIRLWQKRLVLTNELPYNSAVIITGQLHSTDPKEYFFEILPKALFIQT